MPRRSILAVVLAVAVGALSVAAVATASSHTVTPRDGHYRGSDNHHHSVSLYMINKKLVHFEVEHVSTNFPEVHLQGHQVHHTCNSHGWCVRGQWHSDVSMSGTWNNSRTGHSGTFTVHLLSTR